MRRPRTERSRQRRDVVRRAPGSRDARAPLPRRQNLAARHSVVVLGDSMADWLGYGLEEAFSEGDDFGVARRHRAGTSLIRNDARDFDWAAQARTILGTSKADAVVMMTGLADRQPIREAGGTAHEFRSDRWAELYRQRLDEVMEALKSKGVPVIWVGLPPVRAAALRRDLAFLDGIARERAERLGLVYLDISAGFSDEAGDYAETGPDVLGQARVLRSPDGIHFTRAGARKLAHFVDRELRRLLARETPTALPIPRIDPAPVSLPPAQAGVPTRPVAGPVLPLTGGAPVAQRLLGARGEQSNADPTAEQVLVRGEPPQPQAGRADTFAWPPPHAVAVNAVAEPPAQPALANAAEPPRMQPKLLPLPRLGGRSSSRSAAR